MINQNLYPGMISSEIEFFTTGNDLKILQNGKIMSFNDIDSKVFNILKTAMIKDTEAYVALLDWHPLNENKQVEQFTKCRFGGLDFNADICSSGKLQKGEYWECPLRGQCTSEGKICKNIKFKNSIISFSEIRLIQCLVTDMTNDAISLELKTKLGTLHYQKRLLYEKLEISTKQELTVFAFKYNLIPSKILIGNQ